MAEQFISDLKESVREAKLESQSPAAKKGNLVTLYGMALLFILFRAVSRWLFSSFTSFPFTGLGNSSAVGPSLVGQVAGLYLDAMYKA
jgi:sphinganine-1-phosphate aldolase